MRHVVRGWVGATALAAALMVASESVAQQVPLKADLTGVSQVPPIQVPGSGKLVASFDPATRVVRWTITYSGLSGPPIAMHFHGPADASRNAGIAVPITGNFASPISGSATLTESRAAELLGGRWYLNIHTAAHAAGELRGQVLVDTGLAVAPAQQPATDTSAQEAAARAAAERAAQEAAAKAAAERAAKEAAAKAAAERAAKEAVAKEAAERTAQQAPPRPAPPPTPQAAVSVPRAAPDNQVCRQDLSAAMANEIPLFKAASTSTKVSPSLVGKLKAIIARCANVRLEVAGHTDSTGSEDVNKSLSLRRAQAVVADLVKSGIDPSKLIATGYGSARPVDSNDTPNGRARNRRIEVTIQ